MQDLVSWAYQAARRATGQEARVLLPDGERLRIMREQVGRMDLAELQGRQLIDESR